MKYRYLLSPLFIICIAVAAFLLLPVELCAQAISKEGKINGTVKDEEGQPLAYATVLLIPGSQGTTTDEQGHFVFDKIAGGAYQLRVNFIGYIQQEKMLELQAGKQAEVSFILKEATHNLREVSVVGKSQTVQVKEQAYTVSAIDARPYQNTTADINQLLDRTAGVRIREEGGMGSDFNFSLNGFSGRQVRFFLDGIPMDNFGSSLSLNNIPVNMAERIEVYKGVVPVWLGTDALGGAVNIVTNQRANFLDASYSIGSFNTHRTAVNAAYSNSRTGFTVRTNAFHNYSDNSYRVYVPVVNLSNNQKSSPQWVRRFNDGYESAGLQLEAGVSNKKFADQLLLGFIISGNEQGVQTGVTMESVFGAMSRNSQSFIPSVKYRKRDLFTKGLDLGLSSMYNRSRSQAVDTTARVYNWLGESRPRSAATAGENRRTRISNRDGEAITRANLSYRFSEYHSFALNYLFTDFQRQTSDPEDPNNPSHNIPQNISKHTAGFAWQWDYNEKGSFTLFSKLFVMDAGSFKRINFATEREELQPVYTSYSRAGYGMATTYFLQPQLQLKASYEHTYRLPEGYEMFGDGLFLERNPDLKPELSDNLNLAFLYTSPWDSDHRLSLESNFIYRQTTDFIRLNATRTIKKFVNLSDARTAGVEAELRYSWKGMLHASVNASFQDIIDTRDSLVLDNTYVGAGKSKNYSYGLRLPNIPYLFGNASLSGVFKKVGYEHAVLTANWSLHYVDEYFLAMSAMGKPSSKDIIPSQLSQDIGMSYSLQEGKYNISLECRNITDAMLYDNFFLQKPGRAFYAKFRYYIGY